MSALRKFGRQFHLGRIVYALYFRPRQQLDLAGTYGWRLVLNAQFGTYAMRRAADRLELPGGATGSLATPVCFLTGRKFVHQTLFCAHSFARAAGVLPPYEFISDGSLQGAGAAALRRLFPQAIVPTDCELEERVATALPPAKFRNLHALRRSFVLLRKLTDAMAGQVGYRLLFDSDMLFWSEPRELLRTIAAQMPLYLADTVDDGYTATRAEITRALGVPVATGVNSGLVGLDATRIDWELMERACAFLRSAPGDQRLLEQTLWALALGAAEARPLDSAAYRVVVDPPHWQTACAQAPAPVLLHYAWQARLPYAAHEWRRYLGLTI